MWTLAAPWWEFVARAAIVYLFLLILLRVTGKRQVGQLAPFDLVLLLVLSNAVQNSMIAGDASLVGGLIEGRPQVLIHDGKLSEDVMASARLTHHELHAALRLLSAPGCA